MNFILLACLLSVSLKTSAQQEIAQFDPEDNAIKLAAINTSTNVKTDTPIISTDLTQADANKTTSIDESPKNKTITIELPMLLNNSLDKLLNINENNPHISDNLSLFKHLLHLIETSKIALLLLFSISITISYSVIRYIYLLIKK